VNDLFADILYWIALTNPADQWHQQATSAKKRRPEAGLVTTEDVLVEFLAYFGAHGSNVRRAAVRAVRVLLDRSDVEVVPHTTKLFLDGLELYENRLDKSYSMVDCMSMQVMRRRDLADVLTHDEHFTQEGFTTLL
jgi:predicted nucleic acid-binding protein